MVQLRALGWLLLALAIGAIVHDCLNWWFDGPFRLLSLGDIWSRLDLGSLNAVERALRRPFSGVLWTGILSPILSIPALPAFGGGGMLCLWLGGRGGGQAGEAGFLGMPRRRRRRSGGLS